MKIKAITEKPQNLINAIEKAFNNDELKSWEKVPNNQKQILYSHIPDQWTDKALISPEIFDDYVLFQVAWWADNGEPEESIKGYIVGRFMEILHVHFETKFDCLIVD